MDTNFANGTTFRDLLDEAIRQEHSRDERSTLGDLESQLASPVFSKRERPAVARAIKQYLEEQYGQEKNAKLDMYVYLFLARTRLAVHSVPLRQAMIIWVDEYFEGKRIASGHTAVDLITLIVGEAEARRLQHYCVHEAPGSAILKSRKRVVPYTVHPWALEAAKRWLPLVRQHFTDQWLWSLLMRLFRVLPNEVYHEAEYLLDFRRLLHRHPEWGSKRTVWTRSILRPEPEWLRRVGRLSGRGYRTYQGCFVPFSGPIA